MPKRKSSTSKANPAVVRQPSKGLSSKVFESSNMFRKTKSAAQIKNAAK